MFAQRKDELYLTAFTTNYQARFWTKLKPEQLLYSKSLCVVVKQRQTKQILEILRKQFITL